MTPTGRSGALAFALALVTSLLTPALAGAQTQATQSGTATIASGSTSTTATITSVNMTRTFLVFSTTINDANPTNTQVRGELTNATTLTFTRSGTTGAVSIKWSVVEYATGVTVQRGTTAALTGTTNNITIASVNTSKSFPIISYSQTGTTFAGSHFLKAKLTSATNLEVAVATAGTPIVSWQVVEFTNASVQSGDVSFANADSSKTATPTSVNTAKSWLVYSHTSAAGTAANIGQKLVRGRITNATTLTFDRSSTGQAMNLTWYLIEFTDNTSVQSGSLAFTNAQTQQNVTITSVNTAKSFAVGGAGMQEGRSAYTAADNPGVGWMTHELTSATNLRITRALTGPATADMGWFVVTIPKAAIVTPVSGLTTTEAGGAATFTVILDTAPTGNVTISLSSSDTTEGTVSPASVTFTTANWSTPQTVTVTGVDDGVGDGNQSYAIVTAAATSSDPTYSGFNAADVTVSNTDNDTPGITVTPMSGLTTTEAGSTATFTVILASVPAASVTIGLSSSNPAEGTPSPANITFTSANWNTPQTVTITGVNDAVDDGNQAYSIVTAAAASSDAAYNGLNATDVSVSNTDDDTAAITVTPTSGLITTEAGGTATFTVVLASRPTANVTVGLSSSDTTEGTVAPASLTFTTANWSTPQTVTVTGVDDALDDGNQSFSIVTAAAASSDSTYNGMNATDVAASNTDNDTAAITVTPASGLTTTEAGGTATFTVVLASQPSANVTVGLSSNDTTEGTVAPASLTFTTANWSTPQTVTVTGVNDGLDDGNLSYTIVTAAATSTDSGYSGMNAADVTVSNTDDDTAGIVITPTTGLTTTEAAGTATFTVVLGSQPSASVTVGISSGDTTEGTVAPASLTFTTANWSTPRTVTVTGVNDSLDDGDVSYSIVTAAATSTDSTYSGMNAADVTVSNTDNDTAGITVTPTTGLTTTEAGGTATFTVVLASQPTANVTVGLSSNDTTEGTVAPASLTFTTANWSTSQTVTVTGVNDAVDDGNVSYSIVTAAATSTDTTYNGLNAADVTVSNTDNDTAAITVTPTSGLTTTEAGGTANFTVVLASQPTANVSVGLSSSNTSEGTMAPASLTFTTANWSTPQTVTVTGVNDAVDDGNQSYSIVTAAATSTDTIYNGLNAADVTVSNTDNDAAAITVTPTSGLTTTEAGGIASFTVVLASQPTATVTVGLSSSDTTEGTVAPASLTFTTANWNTPQAVTVTGVDDALDDGNLSYSIVTAAATSGDSTYNGMNAANVAASNTDNDTAAITVTPTSGLTTTEAGGTATFTVVLASQPTANVTIGLSSSDTTEGTVAPASLIFTTANWSTPQTVTVTGVNDGLDDGNLSYSIVTAAATSSDSAYSGMNAANVTVSNTDDDTAGIGVTPTTGLTTTEAAGTATFTVVLGSQPSANVTLGISSSDTTEGTVAPASLTFTTANWSTPRTVTVTGVNDSIDDGDVSYSIVTAAATSTDSTYSGMNAADVTVSNTDNDTAAITITPNTGLTTTEAGGTATFTVVLGSQPSASVTLGLSSSDTTEGTVVPASLTFTTANWSTPQTVTVTGVNDAIDDGDVSYAIVTAAATSSDATYNGMNAVDVSVTTTDNDTAGITVTPTSGLTTTEAGGTATFTLVLASQPTATVTLALSSSDSTEGTVSPASITFTTGNWSTPQTVTVTGVDDAAADGSQGYTIVTATATSSDTSYNGLNAADVSVTTTDNDAAGITVTPTSGLTTTEAGGTATFTVVLASQPTATVTVGLSSSDATEGSVSPASVTFTTGNWNTPQTVTVTGVDDAADDGNQSYSILTAAATSSDATYNGLNAADVSVTTIDNDAAGITVTPTSGLTTTEAGGTATFTVVLASQPTANVTIGLSSSDTTEGTVSPTSVTFTSGNWNTPQTVTVTGVDDAIDDGDQSYTILTAAATSGDTGYNGLNAADVSATTTDINAVSITVTPTSGLTTTETGGTATFTVVLGSQPTANVSFALSSSDTTEGIVTPATLTFTAANWSTPQTVTVTGVDDVIDDGNQGYAIVTAPATSADSSYNGLNAADVSVTTTDNDAAGITVTPTGGLATTEAAAAATFTVVLGSQPTANVTVGLSSSDATEGSVSPASLTFTAANWNTPQIVTVTGVDDAVDDGDQSYTIVTAAATSSDSGYNGLNAADVGASNADNDAAAITVAPTSGLTTTEAGGTAAFTVVLAAQPTADVSFALSSSDPTEGTVAPVSLTFTAANWSTPQTVTVTGADDAADDGDQSYTIVTAAATSSDSTYNGLNASDVSVTSIDDDATGITVTPTSGLTTTEAGGTATFTVVLASQPTADVVLALSGSDTTEGTVSPASVTFTSANWSTPQTVTVTGVDDAVDDGDRSYTIVTAVATSADAGYNGLNAADVSGSNADNDAAGITVTPAIGLTTTEAGGSATFTVVLASQPTADVSVAVSSSATAEGTVAPGSLTFTASNWNTPQTVTVTGVDDAVDDGDQSYTIVTAAATSSDSGYDGLNPADAGASNADNDAAGITVTPTTGLTTTEAGGTATFTVVLAAQPTAAVSVALSSSDTTEGIVSPVSVTFTTANWNTPQTVTVTGVNDVLDDGDQSYIIVTGAATSSDSTYNAVNAADVSVTTTDDDATGITVTPTSGLTTTEVGGTATFTVVLTSQPTADVAVGLSSGDATEGTVAPASVTFTSGNWNTPQTVTVTGVDDAVDDGDRSYTIVTAAATSSDSGYDGVNAADAGASNADNDAAGITVTPTSGLTTTEAGGTATFTVVLASQPSADVSVALSSSDTTEGTVGPASLTFTTANWSTPQTVSVTGADDAADDGDQSFTIVTAAATSSDSTYNGLNAADVSVTTADDDAAAITVTPTGALATTEAGATATFTVVLASQPTADVSVGMSSSDTTEGSVSPASLTFTAASWGTPQTVTVTGVDDAADDGDQSYTIVTAAATSSDATYNGMNAADVSLTTTDDDAAGILVNPTSGVTTTEAGGAATFTVVLASQPAADVSVPLSSSDTTEGRISPASLTFTTANWSTAQTVTVTGVDDAVDDGDQNYTIVTGAVASSDSGYNGLNAADVSASNADNDAAAITVTPASGLTTTEAGGTATFTVVLASQPTADVSVALSSSDATEGTVAPASLTFTTANWSTPQTVTVTGVDDAADDGDQSYTIVTAAATSADAGYNGLNAADVSLTTTDNDAVGITVTPTSGLTTTEAGGAAPFTVVLASQPTADVTLGLSSNDTTEGAVAPASVTFTSANWNTPQTVTVTGVDDAGDDGDQSYTIVTAVATSADPGYNGLNAADVSVTTTDNDIAGVTVTPTSGLTTTEAGHTATFTVVLASQPAADITIGLGSSDTTEGTVAPPTLTFTSGNWNTAQTVTVTGVDDNLDDGDVSYNVVTGATASADGAYNGLAVADVAVTTTDDDAAAGVTASAISGSATEAGGTATFTMVLDAQPSADVTIPLSSSDPTEGTASPASLTFTAATWNTPQTVTVTGVDDSLDDGDVLYTISTGAATSSDSRYGGLDPNDVSASTTDNDAAGITVSPSSGLVTSESGTVVGFAVVLNSQPAADVVLTVSSSNPAEGSLSTSSLTFTPADWSTPQVVAVTGVDDPVVDGNVVYVVQTGVAVSADPAYDGINPPDVSATNTDDDFAGITVTPAAGLTTTESGGTAAFNIVLNSRPAADVTIPVSSSDLTEGTVFVTSVTLTITDWNVPHTVTVTGVNDAVQDGAQGYTVVTGPATSADPLYDGLNPDDASLTNADDDTAGITVNPTSGLTTTETGGSSTFTVVLTAEPTADVTIPLTSGDPTEGTVAPASLTFTTANWNTPQTVTVTGVDDAIDDGDVSYTIVTEAATSADTAYNGEDAANVSAITTDDDAVGATISPTSGLVTTEAGGTATFTVILKSQPTADVTIALTSSDLTEGTVRPASLTFTSATWNVAQTVTVTGVDDVAVDGAVTYTIVTGPATSGDAGYNGYNLPDVAATTSDNDAARVTVSAISRSTTEAGGTATFTVALGVQPTANVTISVASSDATEGTVTPATLTFTPANWTVLQTVTVTGVDDSLRDGDIAYRVVTGAATSTDVAYSGLAVADVAVTTTDDDAVGVTVSSSGRLETSEAGSTTTFTVALASQPTADVAIGVSSSDAGEGKVSPSSLTFTAANWSTPQTVTVTGVDDAIDDGDAVYTVAIAPSTSSDIAYSGVDALDVSATNTDDDTPGIALSATNGLITTEGGGRSRFTVALTSQPTAAVLLRLSSSQFQEGTVAPDSLIFTPATWNVPQAVTVTGVDDLAPDGSRTYTVVSAPAISSDTSYDGMNAVRVGVTNVDDDAPGITVTPVSGLVTSETGQTATFWMLLNTRPAADVLIGLRSSDPGEATVTPGVLTFTAANWNTPQAVTIIGVDDAVADGAQAYTIVTAAAVSTDRLYAGLDAPNLAGANSDNDAPGITVTPVSGLATSEAGGSAIFVLALNTPPAAAVTVALSSTGINEGLVAPAVLTFTPANWNRPQVASVTGVDDAIADGARPYKVVTAPAQSLDPEYDGIDPEDVSLRNFDDDVAAIGVTAIGPLTTSESGGSTTLVVALTTRPTADVRIPIVSSNTREGVLTPGVLVFGADNWDNPAEITVVGVNDDVRDGDTAYEVVIGPATSTDPAYKGLASTSLRLVNLDDGGRSNPGAPSVPPSSPPESPVSDELPGTGEPGAQPGQADQPVVDVAPAVPAPATDPEPSPTPKPRQPGSEARKEAPPAASNPAPVNAWMPPPSGMGNMGGSPGSGASRPRLPDNGNVPGNGDTPPPVVPDDAPGLPSDTSANADDAPPERAADQDPSTPDDDKSPADKSDDKGDVQRLPVVQGLQPRQTTEGTPLVLGSATGGAIAVAQADGISGAIEITLAASHGTLSLAGTSGLQVIDGSAAGSASMKVVGSAADISAALDGLTFVPPAKYTGDADIRLEISYAPQSRDTASPSANPVDVPTKGDSTGPHASHTMKVTITSANDAPAPSRAADQAARPVESR